MAYELTVTITKQSSGKQMYLEVSFIIFKHDGGCAWVRRFGITLQKLTTGYVQKNLFWTLLLMASLHTKTC